MYLLMLLATFMSAIYGYNLSARPDYDRDIPRKRAMAVLYRFSMHHNYARDLVNKIYGNDNCCQVPAHAQPGDMLYAFDEDVDGVTMVYDGLYDEDDEENTYILGGSEAELPLMELGRRLYPSNEMVTKVICTDKSLACLDGDGKPESDDGLEYVCQSATIADDVYTDDENEAFKAVQMCESMLDNGVPLDSCCKYPGVKKYLVSYKVVDARWVDRQSGQLNFDFWRALEQRTYVENTGIITKESGLSNGNVWLFRGKMNFPPSFEKQKATWKKLHPDTDFPVLEKIRTSWELPIAIFDGNFFTDKNGNNMCDNGCVFRIRGF